MNISFQNQNKQQSSSTASEYLNLSNLGKFLTPVLLVAALLTGNKSAEAQGSDRGAPSIPSGEKQLNSKNQQLAVTYLFSPPVVAPPDYTAVKASPNGFTERDARFLNDSLYFLRKCFEADKRSDLVTKLDGLKFAPLTKERLAAMTPGTGTKDLVIYDSKSRTILVDTSSPLFAFSAERFFPLVTSVVAFGFYCDLTHKPVPKNLVEDAAALLSKERNAHKGTRSIGATMKNFVATLEGLLPEDRHFFNREIDSALLMEHIHELRCVVRLNVCHKVVSLLDEVKGTLKKQRRLSNELDKLVTTLREQAIQKRDVEEMGPRYFESCRLLTKQLGEFADKISSVHRVSSEKLDEAITSMDGVLTTQEDLLKGLLDSHRPKKK